MVPYPGSDHRIHAHCRLVQDEQLGLVQQRHSEAQPPLLSSTEAGHQPRAVREVQQLQQSGLLLVNHVSGKSLESSEI